MTSNDICLLLVSDGEEWGQYVMGQMTKSLQIRHQSINMDHLMYENPPEVTMACRQSAVVVLLVTPDMLEFLDIKAGWLSRDLQGVPQTSAVVLLLLIDQADTEKLNEVVKKRYVPSDWTYYDLGYDQQEVHQTIARVLDLVEKCQATGSRAQEKEVTDAIPEETVEKVEEARDRKTDVAPEEAEDAGASKETPSPTSSRKSQSAVQFFPSVLYESGVRVAIVFKEVVRGDVTIKVEHTDIQLTPDRENDKVFTFQAPDLLPGKHKVLILDGGRRRGRCSLTVCGAEVGRFRSPHYLCQVLGEPDLHHLDLRLKDVFSSSLPSAGSGLETIFQHLTLSDPAEQQKQSKGVYPTLLHYAAAHGLSELCAALLECPGSSQAYRIHNCEGHDPAELAAKGGFEELENYIMDFMEMETANEIYDRYVTLNPHSAAGTESDSEEYKDMSQVLPPPSRNRAHSEPPGIGTESPPLPPRHNTQATQEGGKQTDSQLGAGCADRPPLPTPRMKEGRSQSVRFADSQLEAISELEQKASTLPPSVTRPAVSPADFMGMGSTEPFQPKLSQGAMGSRSQNELIELNEMFKSKEINVNEAHMLFNAWKQRYGKTASRSFKDRQKELTDIKTEYQKVREALKKEDRGDKSKSFLSRLGFGGRPVKPTVRLHISEPVVQRPQKKGPRVYTKSNSTSQLFSSSDRASNASTGSSSSSSRDSGWSQGSSDSRVSSAYDGDSEKRDSLGHRYLQQLEEEMETQATPPPPLPPRSTLPPTSSST